VRPRPSPPAGPGRNWNQQELHSRNPGVVAPCANKSSGSRVPSSTAPRRGQYSATASNWFAETRELSKVASRAEKASGRIRPALPQAQVESHKHDPYAPSVKPPAWSSFPVPSRRLEQSSKSLNASPGPFLSPTRAGASSACHPALFGPDRGPQIMEARP